MRILYVTKRQRNQWNGTLHKPLQKELAARGVRIVNKMLPIPEINRNYDIFFADVETHAKGWTTINIPKVMFMEDVWPPTSAKMKGRAANRIYKHADALIVRYKSNFDRKMVKLKVYWRQPIYYLPHCVDLNIFKDWELNKKYDALSVGTLMHKATSHMRKHFLETIQGLNINHFRAHADRRKRDFSGQRFSKIINQAKITGTSNTAWQVLAKCFEIPASRSCMFCNYSDDMEDLGFIDGETYVLWNEKNLKDKLLYYLHNEDELKRITDNGYEMVRERHTVTVRADEWMSYMADILEMKRR